MRFFSKLGGMLIAFFNLLGTFILGLGKLPEKIKKIEIEEIIKKGTKSESIKFKAKRVMEDVKEIGDRSPEDSAPIIKSMHFDPAEKENAVLRLQVSAAAFIIASIIYSFNIIPLFLFIIIGAVLIFLVYYILYNQIRVMYPADFNAYRDFFLMYIAVGFLIIIIANNPAFYSLFSFTFLPSIGILIPALIAVAAIFIIFRIIYHRDYTFGEVIEAGENTSQVRVDYDIRSNVKPDIYIVENNNFKVKEHDIVKLAIETSIFNARGNKPTKIIGKSGDLLKKY